MTMNSARLGLPFLIAGQAQKEDTHNEALLALDLLLCGSLAADTVTVPPGAPTVGTLYRIGAGATGAFTQRDGQLAGWTEAGWRFFLPFDGLAVTERETGLLWHYRAGSWERGVARCQEVQVGGRKVLGSQQPAIPTPSGGANVDSEARAAISAILTACRLHGLIAT